VYTPASTAITLTFVNGPVDFSAYWELRCHDNLSTSGAVRERVIENPDILISCPMPNMVVDSDMPNWASFLAWALLGGTFQFYPCSTLADYYNCVIEGTKWMPRWKGPKRYAETVVLRVLQDSQCPADPGVVMRRFYGLTT
jgi:hypothetical protein